MINNFNLMQPPKNPLISIIIPVYNEKEVIETFYLALKSTLQNLPKYEFEILFVDDGSKDESLVNLLNIQSKDSRIRIIELSRNFGKEQALTAGLKNCKGFAGIPIDVDLQDPINLIIRLIEEWEKEKSDIVIAKRVSRESDSFFKRISATIFYRLINWIGEHPIPNNVGDCRLLSRKVIDSINMLEEKNRFMKGIFSWIGFKVATIEFIREKRPSGKTKFDSLKLFGLALKAITSFSSAPIRFWTYMGAIVSFSSFCYATFVVLRTLIFGIDVPGYASLLVLILFIGGIQLMSIGTIGEYISKIYLETKNRPIYIIRNIYEN